MYLIGEQNRRFVSGILGKYGKPVESVLPGPELVFLQQSGEGEEQSSENVLVEISLLLQQLYRQENPIWIGSTKILLENISRHLSYYRQAAGVMIPAERLPGKVPESKKPQEISGSSKISGAKEIRVTSSRVESLMKETQRLQLLLQRTHKDVPREHTGRESEVSRFPAEKNLYSHDVERITFKATERSVITRQGAMDRTVVSQNIAKAENVTGFSNVVVPGTNRKAPQTLVSNVWTMAFPKLSFDGTLGIPHDFQKVRSREVLRLIPGAANHLSGSPGLSVQSVGSGIISKLAVHKLFEQQRFENVSEHFEESILEHRETVAQTQVFESKTMLHQLRETLAKGVHSYFTVLRGAAPWERTVQQSQQVRLLTQWLKREVYQPQGSLAAVQLPVTSSTAGLPATPMMLAASSFVGEPVWKEKISAKRGVIPEWGVLVSPSEQNPRPESGGAFSRSQGMTVFHHNTMVSMDSFHRPEGKEISSVRSAFGELTQMKERSMPTAFRSGGDPSVSRRNEGFPASRLQPNAQLSSSRSQSLRQGQLRGKMDPENLGTPGNVQGGSKIALPAPSVESRAAQQETLLTQRKAGTGSQISNDGPGTQKFPSPVNDRAQPVKDGQIAGRVTTPHGQGKVVEQHADPRQAPKTVVNNVSEMTLQREAVDQPKRDTVVPVVKAENATKPGKSQQTTRLGKSPFPLRQTMQNPRPPVKSSHSFVWRPGLAEEAARILRESGVVMETPQEMSQKATMEQPPTAEYSAPELVSKMEKMPSHGQSLGEREQLSHGSVPSAPLTFSNGGEQVPQSGTGIILNGTSQTEGQLSRETRAAQSAQLTFSNGGKQASQTVTGAVSNGTSRTEGQPPRENRTVQPVQLTFSNEGKPVSQAVTGTVPNGMSQTEGRLSHRVGAVQPTQSTLPEVGENNASFDGVVTGTTPRLEKAFPSVAAHQVSPGAVTASVNKSLTAAPQVLTGRTPSHSVDRVTAANVFQKENGVNHFAIEKNNVGNVPFWKPGEQTAGTSSEMVSLRTYFRAETERHFSNVPQVVRWGQQAMVRAASFRPSINAGEQMAGARPEISSQRSSRGSLVPGKLRETGSSLEGAPKVGQNSLPHRTETALVNRQQLSPVRERQPQAPPKEAQMEFRVLEKKQREQSGNLERQSKTLRTIQQQLQEQGEKIRQLADNLPQNGGQQLPSTQQMVSQVMREIQRQLHFERQRRGG